jgi:hypothetical protein
MNTSSDRRRILVVVLALTALVAFRVVGHAQGQAPARGRGISNLEPDCDWIAGS